MKTHLRDAGAQMPLTVEALNENSHFGALVTSKISVKRRRHNFVAADVNTFLSKNTENVLIGFLRGGCSRGGGSWGTLRIPREP